MPKSILEKSKLASSRVLSPSAAKDRTAVQSHDAETRKNFGWAQGVAFATTLFALKKIPVQALAGVLGTGILIGIGIATYRRQKQEPY